MTKKVLAIVVIYNPRLEQLVSNINRYIENVDALFLWRNSALSEDDLNYLITGVKCPEKISFRGDEKNCGIPYALNHAIRYAEDNSYDYLLTMDQDSEWVNFCDYIEYIRNRCDLHSIYGPIVIPKENKNNTFISSLEIVKKNYVITSGAVYPVGIFRVIGIFDETFFIDAVDEEICLRALKYNIGTYQIKGAYLEQSFGERTEHFLMGKKTITPNYSAFRYYFIVRNHLWLIRSKYIDNKYKKEMLINYVLSPIYKVVLFEKNKIKKVVAIFRGIFDGVFGRRQVN